MSPTDVVAILLAAGQGTRLGGPKALLLTRASGHEIPLIEAQCRDRLAAESTRALAVLRADVAALVASRLLAAGAEPVISTAPDSQGPAGSLAAAAAHLATSPFRAAVITPVDVRVSATTVRALLDALFAESGGPPAPPRHSTSSPLVPSNSELPASPPLPGSPSPPPSPVPPLAVVPRPSPSPVPPLAVVPRFAGRRGHPVVLHPDALARYLAPDPPPLRDHLRSLGDRVLTLDVDDPHVLEDLDFAHQTEVLRRIAGTERPTFLR